MNPLMTAFLAMSEAWIKLQAGTKINADLHAADDALQADLPVKQQAFFAERMAAANSSNSVWTSDHIDLPALKLAFNQASQVLQGLVAPTVPLLT